MIINELEKKVTGSGTRIVFTEGWDPRVQEAAIKLVENNIVVPILLGEPEEILSLLQEPWHQPCHPTVVCRQFLPDHQATDGRQAIYQSLVSFGLTRQARRKSGIGGTKPPESRGKNGV